VKSSWAAIAASAIASVMASRGTPMLSSRRTPSSCKLTALSKLSGCGSAAAINRAEISQYFSGALASQLLNRSHFSFRGDGLCATAAGRTAHGRGSAASPALTRRGRPAASCLSPFLLMNSNSHNPQRPCRALTGQRHAARYRAAARRFLGKETHSSVSRWRADLFSTQ
jgi:hypothetical protein